MRDLQESVKGKSSSHGQSAKPKRISREVLQGCLYRLERHIRKNKLQVVNSHSPGRLQSQLALHPYCGVPKWH